MKFNKDFPSTISPQYSGLFRNYKNISKALDQPTEVTSINTPAFMSQNMYDFSVADFQMSYDPCQCLFPSSLIFSTEGITQADINAYGRLQGIATTKDFTLGNEIDNSKWLTSVWKDDNNGKLLSGLVQYKNVTDMNTRYQDIATGQGWNQTAKDRLDLVKSALQVGLIFTGKPTLGIPEIEDLAKGTEDLSKINDFASLLFNSEQNNNTTPPMTIEGELALTGTVTTTQQNSGFEFQVYNPGSYTTKSSPANDKYLYPIYNEAMGLFALTKTPTFSKTVIDKYGYGLDGGGYPWHYISDFAFKLDDQISYAINPAANVNINNTKITVAWVVELTNKCGKFHTGLPGSPYWSFEHNNLKYTSFYHDDAINKDVTVYMSDFYPIECIGNLIPNFHTKQLLNNPDLCQLPVIKNVYLKINVYYRFNDLDNNLLASPQTFQTFKYELAENLTESSIDLTQSSQCNIPEVLYLGNTHYSVSQDIYAFDKIIINGNLTADPGVIVNLKAKDGIEVYPESSISPEINLMIAPPFDCLPNKIMPSTIDCNDITKYKAGGLSKMAMDMLQKNKEAKEKTNTFSFVIFPNPAANMVQLQYSLDKTATVSFSIYDVSGNLITKYSESNEMKEGKHAINYNTESLSSGIYFCTLSTSDGYSETKKLIIAK